MPVEEVHTGTMEDRALEEEEEAAQPVDHEAVEQEANMQHEVPNGGLDTEATDDDFGDFDEAATAPAQPSSQAAEDDGDFGDFEAQPVQEPSIAQQSIDNTWAAAFSAQANGIEVEPSDMEMLLSAQRHHQQQQPVSRAEGSIKDLAGLPLERTSVSSTGVETPLSSQAFTPPVRCSQDLSWRNSQSEARVLQSLGLTEAAAHARLAEQEGERDRMAGRASSGGVSAASRMRNGLGDSGMEGGRAEVHQGAAGDGDEVLGGWEPEQQRLHLLDNGQLADWDRRSQPFALYPEPPQTLYPQDEQGSGPDAPQDYDCAEDYKGVGHHTQRGIEEGWEEQHRQYEHQQNQQGWEHHPDDVGMQEAGWQTQQQQHQEQQVWEATWEQQQQGGTQESQLQHDCEHQNGLGLGDVDTEMTSRAEVDATELKAAAAMAEAEALLLDSQAAAAAAVAMAGVAEFKAVAAVAEAEALILDSQAAAAAAAESDVIELEAAAEAAAAPLEDALRVLRRLGQRRTYQRWRSDLRTWESQHGAVTLQLLGESVTSPVSATVSARVYVPHDPSIVPIELPDDMTGPSMLGEEVDWVPRPPPPPDLSTTAAGAAGTTPGLHGASLELWPPRHTTASANCPVSTEPSQAPVTVHAMQGHAQASSHTAAGKASDQEALGRALHAAVTAVEEATATAAAVVAALAVVDQLSSETAAAMATARGAGYNEQRPGGSGSSYSGELPLKQLRVEGAGSVSSPRWGIQQLRAEGGAGGSGSASPRWAVQSAALAEVGAEAGAGSPRWAAHSAALEAGSASALFAMRVAHASQLGPRGTSATRPCPEPHPDGHQLDLTPPGAAPLHAVSVEMVVEERGVCLALTLACDGKGGEHEQLLCSLRVVEYVQLLISVQLVDAGSQSTQCGPPVAQEKSDFLPGSDSGNAGSTIVDELFGALPVPRLADSTLGATGQDGGPSTDDPLAMLMGTFASQPAPGHSAFRRSTGWGVSKAQRPVAPPPPPTVTGVDKDPFEGLDLTQMVAGPAISPEADAATRAAEAQAMQAVLHEVMFRELTVGASGRVAERPLGMVAAHEQAVLQRHREWVERCEREAEVARREAERAREEERVRAAAAAAAAQAAREERTRRLVVAAVVEQIFGSVLLDAALATWSPSPSPAKAPAPTHAIPPAPVLAASHTVPLQSAAAATAVLSAGLAGAAGTDAGPVASPEAQGSSHAQQPGQLPVIQGHKHHVLPPGVKPYSPPPGWVSTPEITPASSQPPTPTTRPTEAHAAAMPAVWAMPALAAAAKQATAPQSGKQPTAAAPATHKPSAASVSMPLTASVPISSRGVVARDALSGLDRASSNMLGHDAPSGSGRTAVGAMPWPVSDIIHAWENAAAVPEQEQDEPHGPLEGQQGSWHGAGQGSKAQGDAVHGSTVQASTAQGCTAQGSTAQGGTAQQAGQGGHGFERQESQLIRLSSEDGSEGGPGQWQSLPQAEQAAMGVEAAVGAAPAALHESCTHAAAAAARELAAQEFAAQELEAHELAAQEAEAQEATEREAAVLAAAQEDLVAALARLMDAGVSRPASLTASPAQVREAKARSHLPGAAGGVSAGGAAVERQPWRGVDPAAVQVVDLQAAGLMPARRRGPAIADAKSGHGSPAGPKLFSSTAWDLTPRPALPPLDSEPTATPITYTIPSSPLHRHRTRTPPSASPTPPPSTTSEPRPHAHPAQIQPAPSRASPSPPACIQEPFADLSTLPLLTTASSAVTTAPISQSPASPSVPTHQQLVRDLLLAHSHPASGPALPHHQSTPPGAWLAEYKAAGAAGPGPGIGSPTISRASQGQAYPSPGSGLSMGTPSTLGRHPVPSTPLPHTACRDMLPTSDSPALRELDPFHHNRASPAACPQSASSAPHSSRSISHVSGADRSTGKGSPASPLTRTGPSSHSHASPAWQSRPYLLPNPLPPSSPSPPHSLNSAGVPGVPGPVHGLPIGISGQQLDLAPNQQQGYLVAMQHPSSPGQASVPLNPQGYLVALSLPASHAPPSGHLGSGPQVEQQQQLYCLVPQGHTNPGEQEGYYLLVPVGETSQNLNTNPVPHTSMPARPSHHLATSQMQRSSSQGLHRLNHLLLAEAPHHTSYLTAAVTPDKLTVPGRVSAAAMGAEEGRGSPTVAELVTRFERRLF